MRVCLLVLAAGAITLVDAQSSVISKFQAAILKPANVTASALSDICKGLVGKTKAAKINCDSPEKMLDSITQMLAGKNENCSLPGLMAERNITIVLDLALKKCADISVGCNGQKSVLQTVLGLVPCLLKSLGGELGSVIGLVPNVLGADMKILLAMVGLVVFGVLELVANLLCGLTATLFLLLCPELMFIVFGILVTVVVALPEGLPGLGLILSPIVAVLTILIDPLLGVVGCLVGGITLLLMPVLATVDKAVAAFLNVLAGTTKCGPLSSLIKIL